MQGSNSGNISRLLTCDTSNCRIGSQKEVTTNSDDMDNHMSDNPARNLHYSYVDHTIAWLTQTITITRGSNSLVMSEETKCELNDGLKSSYKILENEQLFKIAIREIINEDLLVGRYQFITILNIFKILIVESTEKILTNTEITILAFGAACGLALVVANGYGMKTINNGLDTLGTIEMLPQSASMDLESAGEVLKNMDETNSGIIYSTFDAPAVVFESKFDPKLQKYAGK